MPNGVTGAEPDAVRIRCYHPSCKTWHSGHHEFEGESYSSGLCSTHFILAHQHGLAREAAYRETVQRFYDATGNHRAKAFLDLCEDYDNCPYNTTHDPRYHEWFNRGVRAMRAWEKDRERRAVKERSIPKITDLPGKPRRRKRLSPEQRGVMKGD